MQSSCPSDDGRDTHKLCWDSGHKSQLPREIRMNGFTIDQHEGKTCRSLSSFPPEGLWESGRQMSSGTSVTGTYPCSMLSCPFPSHTELSLKENGRFANDSMNPHMDSSGW